FQAPRSGYFRITAEAHDSKDHPISAETYAWVSGSEPYVYSYPELEILADKRVYQPGEQARILIHSSVKDALCLLSVEGEKIHSIHRIPIKNGSAEFLLPITGDFMPNIYVAAAIPWAGRLVQGSRVLPVPARDKFLSVQILPDRSEYKPGETASYQIITRDSSGKPASSEVSLGLVDAAIYALRREGAPDIRRFFWGTRENKVFTGFSIPTELSAGGVQKVEAPVEIRRKFLDTAFWDPRILTDEKGEATVSVPLPDNITTWRATARGVTMETLVGQGTKDVLPPSAQIRGSG
ncbi:MAG: alpha-2-macroglobulin, partial [Armatimonadetes bacterium]|nr:alpha-2-macroglobulin [Armatimonadota bacterium]